MAKNFANLFYFLFTKTLPYSFIILLYLLVTLSILKSITRKVYILYLETSIGISKTSTRIAYLDCL